MAINNDAATEGMKYGSWLNRLKEEDMNMNWKIKNHKVSKTKGNVDMSRLMAKPTKWHVRPTKTRISLGIRPVRSESSLSA